MSRIAQWLQDLALLPGIQPQNWQPFQYRHESLECGAADLPAVLRDLGEVTGWLTETGRVITLDKQFIELENLPLAGEGYRDNQHWQLTQLPRGRWQLHTHTLTPCPANQATHLGEPVQHLLSGGRNGRLRYWKLWSADDTGAPHSRIALLADLEENRP